MRKGLIFLLGIISFLGINNVSAETTYTYNIPIIYQYHNNYTLEEFNNYFINNKEIITTLYSKIKTQYEKNYKSNYPYYSFGIYPRCELSENLNSCSSMLGFFYIYKDIPSANYNQNGDNSLFFNKDYFSIQLSYNQSTNSYSSFTEDKESSGSVVSGYSNYIYSNFNLLVNTSANYVTFNINPSLENNLKLYNGDIVPTLNDLLQLDILSKPKPVYLEINLNDWSYVALSLKDYNKIPESNFSTYTEFYIKGQVCITPVYNYGLTERKDILTGTQIEGCGIYTSDFTLDRMYILRDDVKNHAIYYLKPFDKTKDNLIKIDSNLFDITYINEANANNPQVEIEGKLYPTLPYDSLTDTSTKSEEEGYVPGATCSFGDIKCLNDNNLGNIFTEILENPLKILSSVWSAITSIFSLITSFLLLLPPVMQGFLYTTFIISIVLGIIKIIL